MCRENTFTCLCHEGDAVPRVDHVFVSHKIWTIENIENEDDYVDRRIGNKKNNIYASLPWGWTPITNIYALCLPVQCQMLYKCRSLVSQLGLTLSQK